MLNRTNKHRPQAAAGIKAGIKASVAAGHIAFFSALIAIGLVCTGAHADTAAAPAAPATTPAPAPATTAAPAPASGDLIGWIDSKPINEVWLNPGFYSYHWQRDQGLNGDNYGFGGEYRFSTVLSATAGEFYNSDRDHSKYLGVYYQPISIGPVRFGAALGGFDGYPKMRDGGWFLAAIPVASYEYERVGLNLSFVPSYKDRLYGALTFQVKLKVF